MVPHAMDTKSALLTVLWLQMAQLHAMLGEGITSGEVQPLPWTVFARSRAEDAFRYLASGMRAPPCRRLCILTARAIFYRLIVTHLPVCATLSAAN